MDKGLKLLIGAVIISTICGLALISMSAIYLTRSSSHTPVEYFMTVSELLDKKETLTGKTVRISGVVIGDSIQYDESIGLLSFSVVDIPGDYAQVEEQGGLPLVLKNAVNDPSRLRLQVKYSGVQPELLRHMAQAIITGRLDKDGVFYTDEILLKCPSRYEEAIPAQAVK